MTVRSSPLTLKGRGSGEVLEEQQIFRHQVLLVEDNPGDADLTSERLSQPPRAFSIRQVATLNQAVLALTSDPFDAIILDLHLPDSQGLDTLQKIVPDSRGAPVIVVSGFVDEGLRREALNLGAEDVFTKDQAAGHLFSRAVLYVIQRNRARVQQDRLEQLLDAGSDAILIVDQEGIVRYASGTAVRLFDRERESLIGQKLGFSVGNSDAVVIDAPENQRICEMRVVPFEWKEQLAYLASLRDVTAARRSEMRFRRLAESGIIGVVTGDLSGTFVDANDTFLETLGYPREEFIEGGLRWLDILPEEHVPFALAVATKLRSEGVHPAFEIELLRKDGDRAPVLMGAALLDSSTFIAYTADVSQRRRAEQERQQAEERLRRSEEQLRHAQKMEAVGRLAGGVAHDFNNLLSVVLSFAALVSESLSPDDPLRPDIEEIRRAGERGAQLTRQLLLFGRRQPVDQQPLDLNEVLGGMTRMLQRILGEDVDLVTILDPGLGRVLADRGSIEQVIMNLAVNARDAMPTGGKLTIESKNVMLDETFVWEHVDGQPGPHVMLAVTDTGCGMDEETQSRIFEPFFTTKGHGKGTGLGLSTVFGIVRQSGGCVWVYSEVGQGTSFKIYLPRTDLRAEAPRSSEVTGTLQGTETILVVDDNAQVRSVAVQILRRYGYHVLEATDPEQAISLARSHQGSVELLLSDVVMPQMSGPALAAALLPIHPSMRVLCMSGYTDDSALRHGVLSSEFAFLQKPLTPETLARKVREVLNGAPRQDGSDRRER